MLESSLQHGVGWLTGRRGPGTAPLLRAHALGVGAAAPCTAVAMLCQPWMQTTAFVLGLPLAVLFMASHFGIGPAMVTAVTGVLAFDYVFVPPAMAFAVPNVKDALTIVIMVAVATIGSVLAERLRRQVSRASRQAELESLRNTLLSGLSHDLRSPLTALVGAGSALYEDRLPPADRRQLAKLVRDEATRLNRLVANLLELTRLESGGLRVMAEPQALEELIGAALACLDGALEDRPVRTEVAEDVPLTCCDPVLMQQVFVNLLENVIRHTPAGTPLEVAVRRDEGEIRVEIADRGPGLPEGDEERVFDKLYRARGAGDGGMGLGLAICRAIVQAHGGVISLENRSGGGAIARVRLPSR